MNAFLDISVRFSMIVARDTSLIGETTRPEVLNNTQNIKMYGICRSVRVYLD